MGTIERQVVAAQRRLWLNRWLTQWGWSLLFATIAWIVVWLSDRLFALELPMGWVSLGGLGLSIVVSIAWLVLTREPVLVAATALDEAAGLKERIATGLQVNHSTQNPFELAVMADAERSVTGLSARKFIPIRWAGSMSLCSMALAVALLSLLLPEFDVLNKHEAAASEKGRLARQAAVKSFVAKPMAAVQKIIEKNPDLDRDGGMKSLAEALKRPHSEDPDVLRRKAIKQLDRVQNALEKQVAADRFKALSETKKRLKKIGDASDPKAELGKLMESLAAGDFDEAQDAVKKLQEKLTQRARSGKIDAKEAEKIKKQLEQLSKKLQQAGEDKQSERELQNAGLSKADAKRILETLAKKDPKQLEKLAKELSQKLKDQGVSEQQMKQMLEKIQQRQKACQQCQKMGQKMGQAAKQLEKGDSEGAVDELGEAGEMLNEMEQLDMAMEELESQLSEMSNARDQLNEDGEGQGGPQTCPHCNGTGFQADGSPCPHCNGTGKCGGGRGMGARDRDDSAQTNTVRRKAKIKNAKGGRIIGQRFVKGRQLKGHSNVELRDAASAAEVEATDSLNRDRIPRQYRKGVRNYFDRLGKEYWGGSEKKAGTEGADKAGASKAGTDKAGADKTAAGKTDEKGDGEAAEGGGDKPKGTGGVTTGSATEQASK